MRPFALLAALALAAAGCDIFGSDLLSFNGTEVEVRGDAALALENGRLVVSGLDGSRSGGFTLPVGLDRVDVETAPISIPAGGRFGIEVDGGDAEPIASIYNEGTGGGAFDVRVSFADALAVTAVTVRYRLGGEIVLEIPRLPLLGAGNGRRRETSAGSGSGDSGSVHVIRSGGRYIVVSDSEGSGDARRGCDGFFLVPPVEYAPDFPNGLCTDWIEVEPVYSGEMPRGRVAVTARGVGSFTVQALEVLRAPTG